MKSAFLWVAALSLASSLSFAQSFAQSEPLTPQQRVEQFLANHEVVSTSFFCRVDVKTPECRTLIRFKSKSDGKLSASFQITFSAPFRQAGGTEFFLKNESGDDVFTRLADTTVDGKVNVTEEEANQKITAQHHRITIKNLKLGPLVADLSFGRKSAELSGIANGQPVQISYPKFSSSKW